MGYRKDETDEQRRARWREEKRVSDERLGKDYTNARWRNWYSNNTEHRLLYEANGYAEGVRYAKKRVQWALNNGILIKPATCSQCTCTCEPQAHHEDYEYPLKVIWLCIDCHSTLHMEVRA